MRVFLRDSVTGLYANGERWTTNAVEAFDFRSPVAATFFAVQARLWDTEVLFSFDDPGFDFSVPIRGQGPASSRARSSSMDNGLIRG